MKWLRFILSHSIFIACCAAALCVQTNLLLHRSTDDAVPLFAFFATVCSYNFYWLISRYYFDDNRPPLLHFARKERVQVLLWLLSLAGTLISFRYSPLHWLPVSLAIVFTTLYAIPLLPFRWLQFSRRAGVLKTILLAFTWTYVTAFLPLEKDTVYLSGAEYFIITRRFLFMLMLCIIFDSRDSKVDQIRGLRSLATDLSPRLLRLLIIGIFILLFGTNFLFVYFGVTIPQTIGLQLSTLALLITWYYSTKPQGYFFYYFFVDGMMLFTFLATYIAGIG